MSQTKILIIDDDEDIIETTGELLKLEGYKIYSADTTEKGITMIDEVSPDILLLDIMFPEKKTKGFDAAKEIKEKHPDLPIIVFTSINREYSFAFTEENIKADEFINKPVVIEKLVELINKYVKNK